MLRRNELAFFSGGGDERPFGQEIRPAQQTACPLMDGQDCLVGKQLFFDAGDFQVMFDVAGHVFVFESFEVAFTDDTRRQWPGGMKHQIVHKIILPGQDDGQQRLGIHVELTEGVELGKDFQPQKRGFVNNQHGRLFSVGDFRDGRFDGVEQPGQRVGLAVHIETGADLPEDVGHGAGGGHDGDDFILGGVELS